MHNQPPKFLNDHHFHSLTHILFGLSAKLPTTAKPKPFLNYSTIKFSCASIIQVLDTTVFEVKSEEFFSKLIFCQFFKVKSLNYEKYQSTKIANIPKIFILYTFYLIYICITVSKCCRMLAHKYDFDNNAECHFVSFKLIL